MQQMMCVFHGIDGALMTMTLCVTALALTYFAAILQTIFRRRSFSFPESFSDIATYQDPGLQFLRLKDLLDSGQ